jgi:hypothetical protein
MSTLITTNLATSDIRFSGATTSSIEINENGTMSMNQNPFFYGWRDITEAWENFGTTPVVYTYNIASENKGGHYNTGTGVFTCPLSGIYLVCPSALFGSGGGNGNLYVYKNGVIVTSTRGIHSNTNGSSLWHINSATFGVDCAVNDQLAVRIQTSNANVYGKEHSHLSIWYYG